MELAQLESFACLLVGRRCLHFVNMNTSPDFQANLYMSILCYFVATKPKKWKTILTGVDFLNKSAII